MAVLGIWWQTMDFPSSKSFRQLHMVGWNGMYKRGWCIPVNEWVNIYSPGKVFGHTTTVESIPWQDIKNHDKRVARVANTLFNWRPVQTKNATNDGQTSIDRSFKDIRQSAYRFCGLSTILQQFETAVESRSRSKHNQWDMKKIAQLDQLCLKGCSPGPFWLHAWEEAVGQKTPSVRSCRFAAISAVVLEDPY